MELKNGTMRVCGYKFEVEDRDKVRRKMAIEFMAELCSVAEKCYAQQWEVSELRAALMQLLKELHLQGNEYRWIIMQIVSMNDIVSLFQAYWTVSEERLVIHPSRMCGSTLEAVRKEAEAPLGANDEIPWDDADDGAGGLEEKLELDYESLPQSTGKDTICSSIIRHHPDGGGWLGTYLCPPTTFVENYQGFLVIGLRTSYGWGEWGWWETPIGQLDNEETEALAEFLDMCAFCSRNIPTPTEDFDRKVAEIAFICFERIESRYLYAYLDLMNDFVNRGPVYQAACRVAYNEWTASFSRTSCGRDVAEE